MYNISVPIINYHTYQQMDRDNTLSELRRLEQSSKLATVSS